MKHTLAHHFFSRKKSERVAMVWVFLFMVLYTFTFFWHQFLVYRYDVLYQEATQEGAVVKIPDDFRGAHAIANKRSFLTRPDILVKEASMLQSGVRSLISQYRDDTYRMHDTITQNIRSLQIIAEKGDAMVFPEQDEVEGRASYLQTQLAMERTARTESLDQLVELSEEYLVKAAADLEKVEKNLVLIDIEGIKHEITFLDSIYRVHPDAQLTFDPKVFNKMYQESFSAQRLKNENSTELRASWTTLSNLLDPYRLESREIRKVAREKRADIVAQEAEKWVDKKHPEAPFIDIYDQIFISLRDQMMYVYEDGELIISTPITSGRRNYETVRGTFKIYTKQRNKLMKSPFPDEEYELWVDYWMGFHGAYGIHDACNSRDCWRTVYGAASYVYNGSHGCINTPYNAVRFIYNWAKIGTTVHVQ